MTDESLRHIEDTLQNFHAWSARIAQAHAGYQRLTAVFAGPTLAANPVSTQVSTQVCTRLASYRGAYYASLASALRASESRFGKRCNALYRGVYRDMVGLWHYVVFDVFLLATRYFTLTPEIECAISDLAMLSRPWDDKCLYHEQLLPIWERLFTELDKDDAGLVSLLAPV